MNKAPIAKHLVRLIMEAIPPEYVATDELHLAMGYVFVALLDTAGVDREKQVEFLKNLQRGIAIGAELDEVEFS